MANICCGRMRPAVSVGDWPRDAIRMAAIACARSRNPLVRFQRGFEQRFERVRSVYRILLALALTHRGVFVVGFLVVVCASFLLVPFLGRNFFPAVDCRRDRAACARAGRHADRGDRRAVRHDRERSPPDHSAGPAAQHHRQHRLAGQRHQPAPINNGGTIGPQDGDILISLNEDHHPTADYVQDAARRAAARVSRRRPSRSCRPTSSARF